jgi:hypothetical protein
MHKPITLNERSQQHDWKQVSDENVKNTASRIDDAFPRFGWSED